MIQNERIPVFEREKSYKYLGYEIRIDNKTDTNNLVTNFIDTLDKIDRSLLPTSAKLEAISTLCMSKLNFYFPNLTFLEKELD